MRELSVARRAAARGRLIRAELRLLTWDVTPDDLIFSESKHK